ncbi:hypothetical protein I7I48_01204 [Histoplasma ohiense]|nr:hypothetical protein I7I48_01204 [Histoplasma ohiense (nom. inval.)]
MINRLPRTGYRYNGLPVVSPVVSLFSFLQRSLHTNCPWAFLLPSCWYISFPEITVLSFYQSRQTYIRNTCLPPTNKITVRSNQDIYYIHISTYP